MRCATSAPARAKRRRPKRPAPSPPRPWRSTARTCRSRCSISSIPRGSQARLAGATGVGDAVAPSGCGLGRTDQAWPLAEAIRDGTNAGRRRYRRRASTLCRWVRGRTRRTLPWCCPSRRTKRIRWPGLLVAGISPRLKLDEQYRSFLELVTTQIATARCQRAGLRRGTQARRGAGRDRSRQDAVLQQRQPRVPHAADPDAGARSRTLRRRTTTCPPADRERLDVAHRNGLRLLKLVNTLLDFSRIEAGRIQASYEPTDLAALDRGARQRLPLGLRESRAAAARSTARRSSSRSTSTATCGRRSSSTCSPTPSSSPSTGEIAVALRAGGAPVGAHACATPGPASPQSELPRLFERFHRDRGARGPSVTRAPASGWRWCRSS